MPLDTSAQAGDVRSALSGWLASLKTALASGDRQNLEGVFANPSDWCDCVAFAWDIATHNGSTAIGEALLSGAGAVSSHGFHIPDTRAAPRGVKRAGVDCIEAIFAIKTRHGQASGVVGKMVCLGDSMPGQVLKRSCQDPRPA